MLFRTKRNRTQRRGDPPAQRTAIDATAPDEPGSASRPPFSELATLERLGETAVATVTVPELTGPTAMWLIADLLDEVSSTQVKHLVLDLGNVTYMDSGCLGALVEMLTRLQGHGGQIAIVNAGHSVSYLFKLTRLDRLFPICRDVMAAITAVERSG